MPGRFAPEYAITGYVETRGASKVTHSYPNDYHREKSFARNMQATAALLWVPEFDGDEVGLSGAVLQLADLLYEALLVIAPFDRQDVGFAVSRYRGTTGHLPKQARFIALHDWTYGSLRLSGRLLDAVLSGQLVTQARWLFNAQEPVDRDERVGTLLDAVEAGVVGIREQALPGAVVEVSTSSDSLVSVLKPGSMGYRVDEQHREVRVDRVFFSPKYGGLFYEYSLPHMPQVAGTTMMAPVNSVIGVPDQHEIVRYNMEVGMIV
jgi:DEAD/DEAH box helicase domain-containing protein